MNDPEYVQALLDADLPPAGESLSDWTPMDYKQAVTNDLLKQVVSAIVSSAGGKAGKFRPEPRPATVVEQLRKRQQWAEYHHLLNMWEQIPDAPDDGA